MAQVTSVCEECGFRYYLTGEEVELLPTMRPLTSPHTKPYLSTWVEWVDHISRFCSECRYSQPPKSCIKDLAYHSALARKEKKELNQN